MLTRALQGSAAIAIVAGILLPPTQAVADADIGVEATDPGAPTTPAHAGTGGGGKGSSAAGKCRYDGKEIPCSTSYGTWSASKGCWVQLADPQPPPESALWHGHTEGAVYHCVPPLGGGVAGLFAFWAPAGITPALVDPEVLARRAVDSMRLVDPVIGMTPLAGDRSIIGTDTWLWVGNPDERGYGPNTATATAGAVTATATAKVTKVVWDMGDGHTTTCHNPGTQWTPAQGDGASPDCGYRYLTESGTAGYTITATTYWTVDWSGAGQTGTWDFTLTSDRTIQVIELQALRTQ